MSLDIESVPTSALRDEVVWTREMLEAVAFGWNLTDSDAFHLAQPNRCHDRADESAFERACGSLYEGLAKALREVLRFHLGASDLETVRRRGGYLGRTNRQLAKKMQAENAQAYRLYAARRGEATDIYTPAVLAYLTIPSDQRPEQADFLRERDFTPGPNLDPQRFAKLVREHERRQEELAQWRASIVRNQLI